VKSISASAVLRWLVRTLIFCMRKRPQTTMQGIHSKQYVTPLYSSLHLHAPYFKSERTAAIEIQQWKLTTLSQSRPCLCRHGRVGKHRKHPSGRGLAGSQPPPNKHGQVPSWLIWKGQNAVFHKQGNHLWKPVINLDKVLCSLSLPPLILRSFISRETEAGYVDY